MIEKLMEENAILKGKVEFLEKFILAKKKAELNDNKLYFNVTKEDLKIGDKVNIENNLNDEYIVKSIHDDGILIENLDIKIKYEDVYFYAEF